MAEIKYRVRGKKTSSPIYIRFSNGRGCNFEEKSGYFCNPKYFKNSEGKVKKLAEFTEKLNLQNNLNELENHIRTSLNTSTNFTKEWFLNEISKHHGNEPESNSDPKLILVMEDLIHSLENNSDYEIEQSTINTYYVTLSRLKAFQIDVKKEYKISEVGLGFKVEFVNWAKKVAIYQPSTYRKSIKQVKTACRHAKQKMGLSIDESIFIMEKGKPRTKGKDDIRFPIISIDEINKLNQFVGADYLENARDWLVISCWTGCRVGDLMNLTNKNIEMTTKNEPSIKYIQHKTGHEVQLPIHKDVQKIISKHGDFPRKISQVNYNKYIKKLCQEVGMTEIIKGKRLDGTTKRQKIGLFPKFELVASHIGRRSFATNHYGKFPNQVIMKVTSHFTEKQFLKYIGKKDTDHFSDFMKYWEELENK